MLEWIGKSYMRMQKNRHEGGGFSLQEEGGFTLIELLIVIIIIGILAAIAIPTFLAQRAKATAAGCRSDTRNAAEAAVLYASTTADGSFTGATMDLLKAQGFNQTEGNATTITGTPGANITLTTDCPAPVTDAVWSTEGANSGRVTGGLVP